MVTKTKTMIQIEKEFVFSIEKENQNRVDFSRHRKPVIICATTNFLIPIKKYFRRQDGFLALSDSCALGVVGMDLDAFLFTFTPFICR